MKNLESRLVRGLANPIFMKALQVLGIHEFLPAMNPTLNYYVCDLLKIECADILGIFADM